ncbi:MAG TPA: hypothetical protein VKB93_20015 [Thermoanaerobaculia bacterium]|nr:hypothetical protein [Thermoanaerobaculia bacterium]
MRDVADSAIAGTIAALSAAFVFLAFDAIVIELPAAIVCGAIIGASLHFFPRRPLLLGLFLFGAYASSGVSFLIAIAYGAVAGHCMRPTRCGRLAGVAASVATLVISGPLTRTSALSLLLVAVVYAAAYVALARAITARFRDSSPLAPPA